MERAPVFRALELGAIRAHILHHAWRASVYGSWLLDELKRHGYELGYGTLYPTLHRMEEGLLRREDRLEGGRVRKYYVATEKGTQELDCVRGMIRELYGRSLRARGRPRLETHGRRHDPSCRSLCLCARKVPI